MGDEQSNMQTAIDKLVRRLSGDPEARVLVTDGPWDKAFDGSGTIIAEHAVGIVVGPERFSEEWGVLLTGSDAAKYFAFERDYAQFAGGLKPRIAGLFAIAEESGDVVIRQTYDHRVESEASRGETYKEIELVRGPARPPGARYEPAQSITERQQRLLREFLSEQCEPDLSVHRIAGSVFIRNYVNEWLALNDFEADLFPLDARTSAFYIALRIAFVELGWDSTVPRPRQPGTATYIYGLRIRNREPGRGLIHGKTPAYPKRIIMTMEVLSNELRSGPIDHFDGQPALSIVKIRDALDVMFPDKSPHILATVRGELAKMSSQGEIRNIHGRGYCLISKRT